MLEIARGRGERLEQAGQIVYNKSAWLCRGVLGGFSLSKALTRA